MILSASEVALAESDPFGLWHDHYGDENLKSLGSSLGSGLAIRQNGRVYVCRLTSIKAKPILRFEFVGSHNFLFASLYSFHTPKTSLKPNRRR